MTALDSGTPLRTTRAASRAGFENCFNRCPRTLDQSVHAAVCNVEEAVLRPVTPRDKGPFAYSRALLAALVHCYARQLYSSNDICDVIRRDPDFQRLCGEEVPNSNTIRRFRTENRDVIHRCLIRALHFLVEQKVLSGAVTKVSDPQLAEEASRRIIMAAFMDSMELDGVHAADPPVEISYLFANDRARVH